uniref:Uncharacterized protein n=1 Tax=Brassica campestris TaxID=3711 RepID=A0A3P6BW42_BRACM|nr:unnamed protein product [Brassica rapa]
MRLKQALRRKQCRTQYVKQGKPLMSKRLGRFSV